jgi:SAM-dependent methyltransferase
MSWKDLFSADSRSYAQFRPSYPASLFAWLAEVSPARELAVDVGTGSGQAAVGMASRFARVIGVDPSAEQLAHAREHPRVSYRVGFGESTGIDVASADLVLAAQAFHWFPPDPFFDEVRRITKPGGVLALVTYALSTVSPAVDALVARFYADLDPFWEPERRLVETGYATVEVPFEPIPVPAFEMGETWSVEQFAGFLSTWSGLRRSREAEGRDRLAELLPALAEAWGEVPRDVVWPLAIRAFRISTGADDGLP